MILLLVASNDDFSFLGQLSATEYLLLMLGGFFDCIGSITQMKAIMMESPGRLAAFRYSGSVLQFIFDLLIFQTAFNLIQYAGIGVVFAINIIMVYRAFKYGREK